MKTSFYELCKPEFIKPIDDELLERMISQIKPLKQIICDHCHRFRIIETNGVDRDKTAYSWSPKLGRMVKVYPNTLNEKGFASFHTYHGFFKPSLREVYSAINLWFPDWSMIHFVWLNPDTVKLIEPVQLCLGMVFGPEQLDVIDETFEKHSRLPIPEPNES